MSILAEVIGITALVPAMAGPITMPEDGPAELILALCRGSTLVIPMEQGDVPATPATICCAKGCQRRDKHKLVDPEQ